MKQTVSILVENHPGVLSRVSGLFSRRGFNIDSLAVGVTDDSSVSRITIVVDGDDYMLEQVEKQLNKLIDVIKLRTLPQDEIISRELMLIKVTAKSDARGDIMDIAKIMGAKISDITTSTMTVEIADTAERLQTMLDLLSPYGIKEVVRTGTIALQRGGEAITVQK
jgi:acetolactate synthase-1/3 small subunit